MNHHRQQTELQRALNLNINEVLQVNTRIIKISKTEMGLKQEALNTIYKGAILPLMLYYVPV